MPQVAAVGIVLEGFAIPRFDGVWRVGENDIEFFQLIVFEQAGCSEGIAADDGKLFDAVHKHVHAGNGGGEQVDLLAVEAEGAVFAAFVLEVQGAVEQQSARTAGGIINRFARLRVHNHRHQLDNGTVGVELSGGMAAVVGKLLDQIFIRVT